MYGSLPLSLPHTYELEYFYSIWRVSPKEYLKEMYIQKTRPFITT